MTEPDLVAELRKMNDELSERVAALTDENSRLKQAARLQRGKRPLEAMVEVGCCGRPYFED